jgi:hypothetical protein
MASLLDKLQNDGSSLSYNNGEDITINPQANMGNPFSVHSNNGDQSDSYSLNGSNFQGAQNVYNEYNDGYVNGLPSSPGFLDLNGYTPSTYASNSPEGVSIVRG